MEAGVTGIELQVLEETPRLLEPSVRMIENRCIRCGEGWFIGYVDAGFIAWGEFTCEPCCRALRIERTLQRLDAGFRLGKLNDRLLALRARLIEASETNSRETT
jgi:hypothetical protein